jgi:hypothetical protein
MIRTMPQESANKALKIDDQAVTKQDYLSLAGFVEGRGSIQRVHKKAPHADALRKAGEMYEKHEYISAYECFRPVYDKIVSDMQRILARNVEFEANKMAREQHKPLAVAKTNIRNMRAHAQQAIDQFDKLLHNLESKPLVRAYLKARSADTPAAPPASPAPPTTLKSTDETQLSAITLPALEIVSAGKRYRKASYSPPEKGFLYLVRDKAKAEHIIRVIGKSPDGSLLQVETIEDGKPSRKPSQLTADSLAHQAAKGYCYLLLPVAP